MTKEHNMNYVLSTFLFQSPRVGREVMIRAVIEEAAALASVSLFLGMIAIWAQVLVTL